MSKAPPGTPSPKRKRDTTPDWRQSLGFGMEVIGGLVGMGLVGWWADTQFGTSPWLILTGFGLALTHTVWASLKFMNGGKNPLEDLLKPSSRRHTDTSANPPPSSKKSDDGAPPAPPSAPR